MTAAGASGSASTIFPRDRQAKRQAPIWSELSQQWEAQQVLLSTDAAVTLGVKLSLEDSRFEKSKCRSNSTLILSLTVSILHFSKRERMS